MLHPPAQAGGPDVVVVGVEELVLGYAVLNELLCFFCAAHEFFGEDGVGKWGGDVVPVLFFATQYFNEPPPSSVAGHAVCGGEGYEFRVEAGVAVVAEPGGLFFHFDRGCGFLIGFSSCFYLISLMIFTFLLLAQKKSNKRKRHFLSNRSA
jgi:hypothetical protein